MSSFETFELGAEHIDSVAELERLCFSHPISGNNLQALLVDGIGKGFVSVDTKQGEIVAYGGVIVAAGEAQVLNVATHPNYRRQGLGREIMTYIAEYSVSCDAEFITLDVRETNTPAITLYNSMGFYEVGRIKGYYKDPTEDALILKKELCH